MACFSGKTTSNFRFSPPGKFHFLPFPTWKKPKKTLYLWSFTNLYRLNIAGDIVQYAFQFSDVDADARLVAAKCEVVLRRLSTEASHAKLHTHHSIAHVDGVVFAIDLYDGGSGSAEQQVG